MSVFVVNKCCAKSVVPQNTLLLRYPWYFVAANYPRHLNIVVKHAAVHPKDCTSIVNQELISKDLILYREYKGMHKTRVAVFKVPPYVEHEVLAVYLKKYG